MMILVKVDKLGDLDSSRVRLGYNPNTRKTAAVKIIAKQVKGVPVDLNHIRKELKIHTAIRHDNIIKCYGSQENADHFFLVLEYAAGCLS